MEHPSIAGPPGIIGIDELVAPGADIHPGGAGAPAALSPARGR